MRLSFTLTLQSFEGLCTSTLLELAAKEDTCVREALPAVLAKWLAICQQVPFSDRPLVQAGVVEDVAVACFAPQLVEQLRTRLACKSFKARPATVHAFR